MGAAWCRHRAERAHDSKSPLDRVIVRCVDKFYSVDPNATPVRIPRPPPGGISTICGNEEAEEVLLRNSSRRDESTPVRLPGSAGAWQKASLQVPRAEQPLVASSAPSIIAVERSRTPVPPPRRKRGVQRLTETPRPPPPRPPVPEDPAVASKHLLSPPKPRPANTSTVSLPEWRDLERCIEKEPNQPPRPASTSPRPQYLRPPSVTSVSEATLERVETYLRRCRSFGNMSSSGLVDKLSSYGEDTDSDEDPWEGVDDFDHAFHPHHGSPPHTPRSRIDRRGGQVTPTKKHTPVEGRKRRSGATTSTPIATSTPGPGLSDSGSPSAFMSSGNEEISCGRFFVSSAEDEWFNRDYHRDNADSPPATVKEKEEDISEVKKELQSIIYDYNRKKKISVTSMSEVLPTQPVLLTQRSTKKKKISVASITPPPSPVSSDLEDDGGLAILPTAIINGEASPNSNTHSTLLRLLRECQNIEGALEDITNDESDMPRVHSMLQQLSHNNRHIKESKEIGKQVTQSLDSGLDVRGTLERAQDPVGTGESSTTAPPKNADSGVDEDDSQALRRNTNVPAGDVSTTGTLPTETKDTVVRRRRDTRADDDAGSSSGRSSMTPSLSELEAALSDMLEKSAAAGDDDRASPLPPEQPKTALPSSAPATVTSPDGDAPASENGAENINVESSAPAAPPTGVMLIPRISVTSDSSPSVH